MNAQNMSDPIIPGKRRVSEVDEGDNGQSMGKIPAKKLIRKICNKPRRKLCSLGSGECVHILTYTSKPDKVDCFECVVQEISRSLYHFQSSVTDGKSFLHNYSS